jgi:hypothetical protein
MGLSRSGSTSRRAVRSVTFAVARLGQDVFDAIFHPGTKHTDENLGRVVVCQSEPKNGKKGAFKMRDHDQAAKDLQELKDFMAAIPSCQWGLWTNGLEFFFLQRDSESSRFETRFKPIGDWPPSGETEGTKDVASDARLRKVKIVDDDLPEIGNAYRAFRAENPEPGSRA